MAFRRSVIAVIAVVAVVVLLRVAISAGTEESEPATSRVPLPEISKGKGEQCVEDTDFMRRNHMDLLMHQRDDTMLQGIREKKHSLKECVNCHAVPGPDSMALTVASPKHFCRSCHDYAAVKIDCFDCHASRPQSGELPDDHVLDLIGHVMTHAGPLDPGFSIDRPLHRDSGRQQDPGVDVLEEPRRDLMDRGC